MKEPQYIKIDSFGNKFYYKDKEMTKVHRTDGPAIEHANYSKEWWVNGERHREDGPAIERAFRNKHWYLAAPSAEWEKGDMHWYLNGKRHRADGPAIEYFDGSKEWWVNGVELTEEEFNNRMNEEHEQLRIFVSKLIIENEDLKNHIGLLKKEISTLNKLLYGISDSTQRD